MKISGIKTYKFSVPTGQNIRDPHTGQLISSTSKPWLFLKVETDAGIVGWGEGSGEWLVPSVEALIEVSRKSLVPIATGEKLFTVSDFKPLIDRRACAFLQPDTAHCFGITTIIDIAKNAEQSQMLMAPHMAGGPILYAATLHADAVMSNFLIQETHGLERFHRCVEHDWLIKDGYVNIPQKPGLGIEIKEQDIATFPYEPLPYRQYRHADGSWKGW